MTSRVGVSPPVDLDWLAEACYSAVFSDVCDQLGYRAQAADPRIRALSPVTRTTVGWARTARSVAVSAPPERHYGTEIDFIDSLLPGDVAVIAVEAGAAAWGELFSAAALGHGARGTVVDGLVRDRARIAALGYPVFGTGSRPTDSLGRVSIVESDVPVDCGGVWVAPGDLVVGDGDGVVFVPGAHAAAAIEAAQAKAGTESKARELLAGGARLADVWERLRVL